MQRRAAYERAHAGDPRLQRYAGLSRTATVEGKGTAITER